jgi:hypothetical protein
VYGEVAECRITALLALLYSIHLHILQFRVSYLSQLILILIFSTIVTVSLLFI